MSDAKTRAAQAMANTQDANYLVIAMLQEAGVEFATARYKDGSAVLFIAEPGVALDVDRYLREDYLDDEYVSQRYAVEQEGEDA